LAAVLSLGTGPTRQGTDRRLVRSRQSESSGLRPPCVTGEFQRGTSSGQKEGSCRDVGALVAGGPGGRGGIMPPAVGSDDAGRRLQASARPGPARAARAMAVRRGHHFADAHTLHALAEGVAVDRVALAEEGSSGKASTIICWAVRAAVGCSVTWKWRTRRRWWARTTQGEEHAQGRGGDREEIEGDQV